MASDKPDVLMVGAPKPVIVQGLEQTTTLHRLSEAKDKEAFIAALADPWPDASPAWTDAGVATFVPGPPPDADR